MPIANRFVIVCYNIIHCIVFNFVIIIFTHIYIFTNSLFLFMLPIFTTPYPPPPLPARPSSLILFYLMSQPHSPRLLGLPVYLGLKSTYVDSTFRITSIYAVHRFFTTVTLFSVVSVNNSILIA